MANIIRKNWLMNRRAVLKGGATCLALPLLDAMVPMSLSATSNSVATPPKRVVFISHNYGFLNRHWIPQEVGRNFTFQQTTKPLEPFRDQLTFLSGMAHPKSVSIHGGSHYEYLTAEPNIARGGAVPYVASVDQVIASHIGQETRYASLQFATENGKPNKQILSYIDGAPLVPERSPGKLFDKLFGPLGDTADVVRRFRIKSSVLDAITSSASSLKKNVGKADRQKLDQCLSSVRDLEKRLQQQEAWSEVPKPRPQLTKYKAKDFRNARYNNPKESSVIDKKGHELYIELIALALQTDQTRVITHNLDINVNAQAALGFPDSHHELTHSGSVPHGHEKLEALEKFNVSTVAGLLKRLKDIPEAGGSLLDNTLVHFGSPNGQGGHSVVNLPIVLCGNVGGRLTHGQHIHYEGAAKRKTPLSNLFLTMLHAFDIEVERFRDSQTTVSGLLA